VRIAWIGGVERNEVQLGRIALEAGHDVEFHSGHIGGRGAGELRAIVERADFVVILTDVNSHGAVLLARKVCRQLGRTALLTRRCGTARFQRLIEALATRHAPMRRAS
jgi:hypothetical protein